MEKQNLPIYSLRKATEVIYSNISTELVTKYPKEKIYLILFLMDEYYDLIGINVHEGEEISESEIPITVDEDKLVDYICKQTLFQNICISKCELKEILNAELIYCEQLGIINK